MPQGPVGVGCDACRAQKKKCDRALPACSRCEKLRIACVGGGQKRFKFLLDGRAQSPQVRPDVCPAPQHAPSNDVNLLQQAVVARVNLTNDVRYHPIFRWGFFLLDLPKRLGSNEALDAATTALLARHTEISLRHDQTDPRAPAMKEYTRALAALRVTLNDGAKASSSETLCAVMLLVYCQARFDDQFTFFWSPHGRGIAHLVRARNFTSGSNPFEIYLFASFNATLILQSFANPDVNLTGAEYRKLEQAILGAASFNPAPWNPDIQHWLLMIQISELMKDARDAIRMGSSLDELSLRAQRVEDSSHNVLHDFRERLKKTEEQFAHSRVGLRLHASHQRIYGVALSLLAILYCAQRTISPAVNHKRENSINVLCNEILQKVDEAKPYRPVGAVWTVHTLICTWCVARDVDVRSRVEVALLDYQRDAVSPKAELPLEQLRLLEKRLHLREW